MEQMSKKPEEIIEKPGEGQQKPEGVWGKRLRIFWSGWDARLSVFFVLILLIICVIPQDVWPTTARSVSLITRHRVPYFVDSSSPYFFGTDHLGRDLFYRILASTRLTLLIAFSATLFSLFTGTTAGVAAGYFRGKVDAVTMQLVDIMLSFPILLLVLALVATLGRNLGSLVLVLGISGWAQYTRVIRSVVLSLVELDFIESAKAVGCSSFYILIKHILPNIASSIFVLSTLNIAQIILTESAISFLGLGPSPPDITWGGIIGEGRNYIYDAWWSTFFSGLVILITVLCFNFLGDAMREAFDPRTIRDKV